MGAGAGAGAGAVQKGKMGAVADAGAVQKWKVGAGAGAGADQKIRFGAGAGAVAVQNKKKLEQVRLRVRSVKSFRLKFLIHLVPENLVCRTHVAKYKM